jgi:hypothetical protein
VVYKQRPERETDHFAHIYEPGGFPNSDLIVDTAGNLYGTTTSGGDQTCS